MYWVVVLLGSQLLGWSQVSAKATITLRMLENPASWLFPFQPILSPLNGRSQLESCCSSCRGLQHGSFAIQHTPLVLWVDPFLPRLTYVNYPSDYVCRGNKLPMARNWALCKPYSCFSSGSVVFPTVVCCMVFNNMTCVCLKCSVQEPAALCQSHLLEALLTVQAETHFQSLSYGGKISKHESSA